MIQLTHLDGRSFVLNAHRIETIEGYPDTVVTTVDGKHFVVREPVSEVVAKVIAYQQSIQPGFLVTALASQVRGADHG